MLNLKNLIHLNINQFPIIYIPSLVVTSIFISLGLFFAILNLKTGSIRSNILALLFYQIPYCDKEIKLPSTIYLNECYLNETRDCLNFGIRNLQCSSFFLGYYYCDSYLYQNFSCELMTAFIRVISQSDYQSCIDNQSLISLFIDRAEITIPPVPLISLSKTHCLI